MSTSNLRTPLEIEFDSSNPNEKALYDKGYRCFHRNPLVLKEDISNLFPVRQKGALSFTLVSVDPLFNDQGSYKLFLIHEEDLGSESPPRVKRLPSKLSFSDDEPMEVFSHQFLTVVDGEVRLWAREDSVVFTDEVSPSPPPKAIPSSLISPKDLVSVDTETFHRGEKDLYERGLRCFYEGDINPSANLCEHLAVSACFPEFSAIFFSELTTLYVSPSPEAKGFYIIWSDAKAAGPAADHDFSHERSLEQPCPGSTAFYLFNGQFATMNEGRVRLWAHKDSGFFLS